MTRNLRLLWLLLLAMTIIDALWLWSQGMSIAPRALVLIFLPILAILFLAWFYTKIRPDRRLSQLANMTAATLAFMSASCIMSYLTATMQQPLIDPSLVKIDHAMGLDWLAMYQWIVTRPLLHGIMQVIYMSLIPQIIILQLVLNFRSQLDRAWECLWLFMVACLICVVCSGIWPAAGAFSYFHVELNEPYVREMAALRNGTLTVIGSNGAMQGVVEFPSLHMALALLYPYSMRGIRVLFPIFLILDALVIVTTPAIGGHHFADLWGGAAVALVAILVTHNRYFRELVAEPALTKKKRRR
jgi:hypothetical protein